MKREIKFRGKSIYGEEWLYGSLVKIAKGYKQGFDNGVKECIEILNKNDKA